MASRAIRRSAVAKPLYRKVNTKARGVHHGTGGDYRHARNTKRERASDDPRGKMRGRSDRGLDYTPLFKFLLSKVGADWDDVYSEARSRLDREEPIFWMVARVEADRQSVVRLGDSTYFSGLYIDPNNRLAIVDVDQSVATMMPRCACCTHTFNGTRFVRRYRR
ncbi:MAG TPA: hypothetical protein VGO00_30395 [Kofleriaceae bacterium]|nr:hypothetical protein [Kofleriaceae bacterium]